MNTEHIAGVDGCRDGWVVVRKRPTDGALHVEIVHDLCNVFADPSLAVIAVDVPIGLPDAAAPGGRSCDAAARRMLGPKRKSSVFSAPVRAVLAARDYPEAAAASRASSAHGLALSRQAFAIVPKIAAVDALMTPAAQRRIVEVHPECCFAAMNGGTAVALSKKRAAGRAVRLALLLRHWAPGVDLAGLVEANRAPGVARDDIVDAMAACWSAERVLRGDATRLPVEPAVDARGLRMEIWC